MERRLTFDGVAALYDAARPDYPEALFNDLVDAAGLARDDAILELGCGTGQATRRLASKGFPVVALDPGAELIRVAKERLAAYSNIEFVDTTFEAWQPKPTPFRLIVAAQSFHWIAPELRFAKAAKTLSAGGYLSVFGNVPMRLAPPIWNDFEGIYARYAPHFLGPPPESWYLPSGPIAELYEESGFFERAAHSAYSWDWRHTATSYADYLRTLSGFRLLEPENREALLTALSDCVATHGGSFEIGMETHLYLARRKN